MKWFTACCIGRRLPVQDLDASRLHAVAVHAVNMDVMILITNKEVSNSFQLPINISHNNVKRKKLCGCVDGDDDRFPAFYLLSSPFLCPTSSKNGKRLI